MSRNSQNLLENKSVLRIKPNKLPKRTIDTKLVKKKPITRIGETDNFIIDYDSTESLILMFGKEAPTLHGFKLGLDEDETKAIIHYLKQAKALFPQS
jgi:hypothetical protein